MSRTPSTPSPATAGVPARPTVRSARAWAVLLVVVVLGVAADLGSKAWAFRAIAPVPVRVERERVLGAANLGTLIPPHEPKVIVPGLLEFTLVLNRGAVFGIGAGKRWLFVGFTLAAVGFGVWMFAHWTRPRDHLAHAALGLLLSGGLGNLYDRVVYACVRDFIHPLPGMVWPGGISTPWSGREVWPYVSNVADLFLIVGIAMLLVHLWRAGNDQHPAGPPAGAGPDAAGAGAQA